MTWLARLKKIESTQARPLQNLQKGAFVGFVGNRTESIKKSKDEVTAPTDAYPKPANDEERGNRHADDQPLGHALGVERMAVPGRTEDAFAARLALFTDRGMRLADAERLAHRMASRDQEGDERRLCLECRHLSGGVDHRRCSQWQIIGIGSAAIPGDLVTILQRCAGFTHKL